MEKNPMRAEFVRSIQHLSREQLIDLLWAADEAVGASAEVLRNMKSNAGGDQFEYAGSMNMVEIAGDETQNYRDLMFHLMGDAHEAED